MNDFKRNDRFGGKPRFQRSGGFGRPQQRGQMHPATCAECGKPTEVPFRPDGSRPIYCRDCFGNAGQSAAPAREYPVKRNFSAPRPLPSYVQPTPAPDARIDAIQQTLAKMQSKMDLVLLEMAMIKAQFLPDQRADVPKVAAKKPKSKKK